MNFRYFNLKLLLVELVLFCRQCRDPFRHKMTIDKIRVAESEAAGVIPTPDPPKNSNSIRL